MAGPFDAYEGRKVKGPDGNVYVVRNGKPEPFGASSAAPGAGDVIATERGKLATAGRVADLGERFLGYNRERGTGGVTESDYFPDWGQPNRQAMDGISSQMLAASIQPGQSKSMDSNAEMAMTMRRLPSTKALGPINEDRVAGLHIDLELQRARLSEFEKWAAQKRTLDGFEDYWAATSPALRQQFETKFPGGKARAERGDKSPKSQMREYDWIPGKGKVAR